MRTAIALALGFWMATACLSEPFDGSTAVVDFLTDLDANQINPMPDGSPSHYEIWANFGTEGTWSLGSFIVTPEMHVQSYPDIDNRIGSITGADDQQRSGARFRSEGNLERATGLFVTLEPDGETDAGHSGIIIMQGPIALDSNSVMRGNMAGEYTNRLGNTRLPVAETAIILTEDNSP